MNRDSKKQMKKWNEMSAILQKELTAWQELAAARHFGFTTTEIALDEKCHMTFTSETLNQFITHVINN